MKVSRLLYECWWRQKQVQYLYKKGDMSDSLKILPLENFQSHDNLERKTRLETFF